MSRTHPGVLALPGRVPAVAASAFVAPGATVVGAVRLAERSSVWYSAVLRADSEVVTVGEASNLQDGVVVHADPGYPAVVGDRVTVGHGAVVHGATVEDDCLIGMRAVLLNGVRIGRGSLVAAGAVVLPGTVVPAGSLVAGVPAKVRRATGDAEATLIAEGWREYVDLAAVHREARPAGTGS